MYSVFGVRGATYFLGVSEWLFGALLFAGFWNKKLAILGSSGACGTFIATSTIIPFFPGRLGDLCWRLASNDRAGRFSYKGSGSPCRIVLPIETGCAESVGFEAQR
jgi:uncharacterized membrane protein YkgB